MQTFTLAMCQLLSSKVPGFEGHYIYAKRSDEEIRILCRDEMRYWNSDYSTGDDIIIINPAWQVEDILSNAQSLNLPIGAGVIIINMFDNAITKEKGYKKIEEYLWSIFR